MARILLLQRSPQVGERLRQWVGASPGLSPTGVVETMAQARPSIAQHRPDLVVADLRLTDGPITTLLRQLRGDGLAADPQWLLLAASADDPLLFEALRTGADSYFVLGRPSAALLSTVSLTLCGESAMSAPVARQVLRHLGPARSTTAGLLVGQDGNAPTLDETERELLQALADGLRPEQAAQRLQASPRDVGLALRGIYRKLQADLRAGALTLLAA
jgi:DNA-binding NarL/FixJ family response regulator